MSNVAITKKEILLGREITCPNCESEIEYFVSETNSEYLYCQTCNYNTNTIIKHITFDKILKSIQVFLSNEFIKNINEIKIFVKISNGFVNLYINHEKLSEIELLFDVNNRDILMFENTINDLLKDALEEGKINVSINISK